MRKIRKRVELKVEKTKVAIVTLSKQGYESYSRGRWKMFCRLLSSSCVTLIREKRGGSDKCHFSHGLYSSFYKW